MSDSRNDPTGDSVVANELRESLIERDKEAIVEEARKYAHAIKRWYQGQPLTDLEQSQERVRRGRLVEAIERLERLERTRDTP